MRRLFAYPVALLLAVPAAAAPVTVTRFFAAGAPGQLAQDHLAHAAAAVVPAPGGDPASLEFAPWLDAVGHELPSLGLGAATPGAADILAEVRVERQTSTQGRHNPVSVGLGGTNEGYHSSFGMGVGFTFGGGPKTTVWTRLTVTLRDRATGKPIWEGRAENVEGAKDKRAAIDFAAPRLAHAVFVGFPGTSGATITVK